MNVKSKDVSIYLFPSICKLVKDYSEKKETTISISIDHSAKKSLYNFA